jgi:hypothetical protein
MRFVMNAITRFFVKSNDVLSDADGAMGLIIFVIFTWVNAFIGYWLEADSFLWISGGSLLFLTFLLTCRGVSRRVSCKGKTK